MAENSLPFAKVSSFQSFISRKQLREIELQMAPVSAISFGWFADFENPYHYSLLVPCSRDGKGV